MKKTNLNVLAIALLFTIVGFLMDGDVKEPSMLMRFVEFFMIIYVQLTRFNSLINKPINL